MVRQKDWIESEWKAVNVQRKKTFKYLEKPGKLLRKSTFYESTRKSGSSLTVLKQILLVMHTQRLLPPI